MNFGDCNQYISIFLPLLKIKKKIIFFETKRYIYIFPVDYYTIKTDIIIKYEIARIYLRVEHILDYCIFTIFFHV